MRNSLRIAQYLLFALLMFVLSACGTSNTQSAGADKVADAKLTANLVLPKSAAKSVGLQADVTKTRLTVTGPAIPTVRKDFANNTGGTLEVYPGSDIIVTAQGFNTSGAMIYEGFATNVTVASGATQTVTIQLIDPTNYIKAADTNCLSCHESTRDITGQSLVADYKQSKHYTNDWWTSNPKLGVTGTGCAACHGPNHNDLNPSDSGRCYECHNATSAFSVRHYNTAAPLVTARYLSPGNNNCSACHEPHNPIDGTGKQERKDWAASGHGNNKALAWMDYDFTTRAACNACHTPSGFTQAVETGWVNTNVIPGTAMQPLTCDGCHSSNDFAKSVRSLNLGTVNGGYKAGMGGFGSGALASVQFPNVGESNVCVPCHASRENGASILKTASATGVVTATNFANSSFKNPHYLGAAAVFYGQGGFQFYTSQSKYTTKYGAIVDGTIIKAAAATATVPEIVVGDSLTGNKAPWNHGKLGMDNFQTTTTAAVVAAKGDLVYSGTKGQCVACHLGPENTHSFDAFKAAEATWKNGTPSSNSFANGTYAGCYGCHTNENMKEVAELSEKPKYDAAMAFFKWQLAQNGAVYSEVYPYFYKADGVTALKNWMAASTVDGMILPAGIGTGAANMGAALNFKLLAAEKGAHVHNRTFMKQLIFDSVQYLQTGTVTFSNRNIASGSTDPNGLINFSNYSTSLIPTGNAGLTTQTVRGYIVRKNTAAPTAGFYTRP